MFRSLEIKGYRVFPHYRLDGLARVNLLVGKNNCGKTSVLEAVHLLASGGDPDVMAKIVSDRGEVFLEADDSDAGSRRPHADISHLFHERRVEPPSCFAISTNDGLGSLKVEVVQFTEAQLAEGQQRFPFSAEDDAPGPAFRLHVHSSRADSGVAGFWPVRITGTSAVLDWLQSPSNRRWREWRERREGPPVFHVSVGASSNPRLRQMWNNVVIEGREDEVVRAMRVLEPRTESVFFLTAERDWYLHGSAGVLLGVKGEQQRHPIGSYGEGMTRLLTLALAMVSAKGGVLLVDEIDTGLHYSVLGDMWRLVVEAARQTNVQVFATTHSYDCLRGLAWVCENHPNLSDEVSVQKIEPSLEKAVALGAEEIVLSIAQGTEMR